MSEKKTTEMAELHAELFQEAQVLGKNRTLMHMNKEVMAPEQQLLEVRAAELAERQAVGAALNPKP